MIFKCRFVACLALLCLSVGCTSKQSLSADGASKLSLSERYDLTIEGLREGLAKYTDEDYAYQGSKDTLKYLEGIGASALIEPRITLARKHSDWFVIYWVGQSLEVKGINVSIPVLAELVFIEIPTDFLPEMRKAEYEQVDFVGMFPMPEINALEQANQFEVQLVLEDGSLSSFFRGTKESNAQDNNPVD